MSINKTELEHLLGVAVRENVALKNYTSVNIGGPARFLYEAKSKKELIQVLSRFRSTQLPLLVIGKGSNLLVGDEGFPGLVIVSALRKYEIFGNKIIAEPGVMLMRLCRLTEEHNLGGMEGLAGIPGTIGGAVYGNAAAFGSETGALVETVEVFDLNSGEIINMPQEACKFGYRDSWFKHHKNLIILSVKLSLPTGQALAVDKMQEHISYRQHSFPVRQSLGCVFKNIKGENFLKIWEKLSEEDRNKLSEKFVTLQIIPAGWLIELLGFKGKTIGGAQLSPYHGNYIVNENNSTAADYYALVALIQQAIKKRFDVDIETEIQIITNDN